MIDFIEIFKKNWTAGRLVTSEEEGETEIIHGAEVPVGPYDEPLADPEWLEEYKKKKELEESIRKQLQDRIDGKDTKEW